MRKTVHTISKHITKKICVMGLTILSIVSVFPVTNMSVQAATLEKEPRVVIAVDSTTSSPCSIEVKSINIETKDTRVKHLSCPQGTVIGTKVVTLSNAQAMHEDFVLVPADNSSDESKSQADKHVIDLMHKKDKSLRTSSNSAGIKPFYTPGCQNYLQSTTTYWSPTFDTGISYTSNVQWKYVYNGSCSPIDIMYSGIRATTSGNYYSHWDHDAYAGQTIRTDCPGLGASSINPTLNTGASFFNQGYYYQQWVQTGVCNYPWQEHSYVNVSFIN